MIATQPYCTFCGIQRPADWTETVCVPCANTGHLYRLVSDEKDRQTRLRRWLTWLRKHGYTEKQIDSIPTIQNLRKFRFVKGT